MRENIYAFEQKQVLNACSFLIIPFNMNQLAIATIYIHACVDF